MGAYQVVTQNETLSSNGTNETFRVTSPVGTVPVSAGIQTTSNPAYGWARLVESYPDGCDWVYTVLGSSNIAYTVTFYLVCLEVYTITVTPEGCGE